MKGYLLTGKRKGVLFGNWLGTEVETKTWKHIQKRQEPRNPYPPRKKINFWKHFYGELQIDQ